MISASETEGDRQNTPPEDVPIVAISDTSSGSNGDHRPEFEEALDIVPISSSNSFITEAHEVVTLEDEPTDPRSEPEVTPCHVATSKKEEATTSSASVDMKDLTEEIGNLFSHQEEFWLFKEALQVASGPE